MPEDEPFPSPPEPAEPLPGNTWIPKAALWWMGAAVLFIFTAVFVLRQCGEGVVLPGGPPVTDPGQLPAVNQETDLEFRADQLWYKVDEDKPFSGAAVLYHPNGKMMSRTIIQAGKEANGTIIEKWDADGKIIGPLWLDER